MRNTNLLPAVALATMTMLLTSCSRNPVAPTTGMSGQGGAGSAAVAVIPDDTPTPGTDGGTPSTETQSYLVTSEGSMTVGRWTLTFRKNSLTMPATITLWVSDPEAMDVHIDVQPPAANNFSQPVVLTANTSDVNGFDYSTGDMQVWSGGNWQALPAHTASSHPNQQNVVAHFNSLSNTMVMNDTPKHVVSTTLKELDWSNSSLVSGNVAETVAALKRQPGENIQIYGSPTLVRSLLRDGLLDELELLVHPIVVGGGYRLFENANYGTALRLVDSRTLGSGVLALRYAAAGA